MTLPRVLTVVVAAACVPCAVLRAEPATRPAADARPAPATRPVGRATLFGNRMLRLRDLGLAAPDFQPAGGAADVSDGEWAGIAEFAKTNFPNRWQLFEQLEQRRGRDNALVKQLRDRITGRYRVLMRVQLMRSAPSGLYEAALEQGRLEDAAWAAVIDTRRKPGDAALQKRQRDAVAALVKSVLAEKEKRLEALKQSLADEQEQLESDKANLDGVIDRQIARLGRDDPAAGFGGQRRGWDRPEPNEYRYAPPATQPE